MLELIAIAGIVWLVWLFGALCVGLVALLIQPRYWFDEVNAWSPEQDRVKPQA